MDDIIVTSNNVKLVEKAITKLKNAFLIRDLGSLSYFLCILVSYNEQGLMLSQKKYILDLLKKLDMQNAKPHLLLQ